MMVVFGHGKGTVSDIRRIHIVNGHFETIFNASMAKEMLSPKISHNTP